MSDQGREVWIDYDLNTGRPTGHHTGHACVNRPGITCTRMVPAAAFDRLVEAVREIAVKAGDEGHGEDGHQISLMLEEALREAGVEG